ncbi:hypothetical protein SDC9_204976 [bioreactor metagenome]|uniref:Uncharacterized protein n=1 Tax=bioreactor metagenome TaxID=1076179 RepID=A0A645J2D7_9ZZZZ
MFGEIVPIVMTSPAPPEVAVAVAVALPVAVADAVPVPVPAVVPPHAARLSVMQTASSKHANFFIFYPPIFTANKKIQRNRDKNTIHAPLRLFNFSVSHINCQ